MSVVVIGSGPAGITVASEMRRLGSLEPVTVISAEPFPPYSPPAMADYFLTGRRGTLHWQGEDVGARLGLREMYGRHVIAVRPGEHAVDLDGGERLLYDTLVIASGSRLHATMANDRLTGIHDFKSLTAANRIVDAVRRREARTALVTGCGFIGVEIALLLADLGVEVTILGRRGWVMPRMLDTESAAIAERHIRARGVKPRLGVAAHAFAGDEHVEGVRMADGAVIRADLVIAATGIKPHVEFLAGSGIGHEWGIAVDDRLRCSVPDVFACGDVAEAADRWSGERYVHATFPNAVAQAKVVARNICGVDTVYAGAEAMNSMKHLGLPVMAVGAAEGDDELRRHDGEQLRRIFLKDGRIAGFRLCGDTRAGGVLRALMLRGDDVRRYGSRLLEPDLGMAAIFWSLPVAAA